MDDGASVQPEALPAPQPQGLPTVVVVDDPEVGKLYWIYLKYPQDLNDDSSEKGQPRRTPPTEQHGWHTINAPTVTGNVRTSSRHMGLLVHYDPTTKLGALFIGTGAEPGQPQRFVPWRGTQRLPKQPPRPLTPDPADAFMRHQGYLNYSHLICARVVQQGEPGVGNFFPGLVHVREIVAGAEILRISLSRDSMTYLKHLNEAYWNGVRYNESGEIVSPGHWGGTGGAGGGQGGAGVRRGRHHGAQGGRGASQGRKKTQSARARGVSDPVDPVTGLSLSMLMQIAEAQASAADEQARLAAGELDDKSGNCVVALFPLVGAMISRCDPFPSEVVAMVSPDGIQ